MRRDLKKYFEVNFGTFVHVSAHEIEAACSLESPLCDLEGFLFLKEGQAVSIKPWIIPSASIRKILTETLNNSKN
ncbi:hypothetical protein FAM09_23190 [Niastella caeni]|uniref:Uncharacterized protein n=1 Tax=Niastella caeni TaxID=2569763 RepID=A0A4S8HJV8_9BACT|nr:hypothetical protein [Niastella caeni]THU34901.1 hypothetical protein FAM09_23190 [Niastella caeni]